MSEFQILVVDDDDIIVSLLEAALTEFMPEADILIARNYKEAQQIILNKPLHIALIDLHLNDIKSGVHVAQLIREHTNAGIVFMTGDQTRTNIQDISSVKPEAFLSKPFETNRLAAILRKVINARNFKSVVMVEIGNS